MKGSFCLKFVLTAILFVLSLTRCESDPTITSSSSVGGLLDTTFDTDGVVLTDFGRSAEGGYSVAIASDGKILVAGYAFNGANDDFALTRHNADGSLDSTFGTGGVVMTDFGGNGDYGYAVAIASDEKILVIGHTLTASTFDFALARYDTDGSLDSSFGTNGKVLTDFGGSGDYGRSVAIQSDEKIVVAGYATNGFNEDFALARYDTDGSLDTTFDSDGVVTTDVAGSVNGGHAVAIQSDGKIVVAGYVTSGFNTDFALARYNTNGSLDSSFDFDGVVTTDFGSGTDIGYAVAIQPDGKIVVAGSASNGANDDFALARYDTDGLLDFTFDSDGRVLTDLEGGMDIGYAIAIQSDGEIVVAGRANNGLDDDFALARYNP